MNNFSILKIYEAEYVLQNHQGMQSAQKIEPNQTENQFN